MKAKFWSMVCLLPGVALSFTFAAGPQSGKRLWVLQEPGQVVEYDPSTWAVKGSVKVPVEFGRDPESLQINRNGQMLFCADPPPRVTGSWLSPQKLPGPGVAKLETGWAGCFMNLAYLEARSVGIHVG